MPEVAPEVVVASEAVVASEVVAEIVEPVLSTSLGSEVEPSELAARVVASPEAVELPSMSAVPSPAVFVEAVSDVSGVHLDEADPACVPYRRPESQSGAGKLQTPSGSHLPSEPHTASLEQKKILEAPQANAAQSPNPTDRVRYAKRSMRRRPS